MRKFLRFLGVVSFLALIGIGIFVQFYAPYWVIKVQRNTSDKTPADFGMVYEDLTLRAADGITLSGYWLSAERPRGTVLLVHGIRGFKEYWWYMDQPRQLLEAGYNVVAFDNRAHGRSGGEYCTYGYMERGDVSCIIDYIEQRQPGLPLAVWGHSLGGSIALLAMEDDQRIDAGIIESTFTDMHQIVYDYGQRMMKGFNPRFLSDYVTDRAAGIAGFDAHYIKPLRAVGRIDKPLFLAHGDADHRVKFDYGKRLYECTGSACKTFYPVPGAKHIKIWEAGGPAYHQAVLSFLKENLF